MAARLVLVLATFLGGAGACGSDSGGGGGGDDDDDGGDGDGGPGEGLAAQLAGEWFGSGLECADVPTPVGDDSTVDVTFDGAELVLRLYHAGCIQSARFDLTYDDAAGSIRAAAAGTIDCIPASCDALCDTDVAQLLPGGVSGAVAVTGDTLTLTSTDETAFPALVCAAAEVETPAVFTFTREDPQGLFDPADIDETVCDAIDPFAAGRTVYYVAQNQPGADNDACDGLAPADEGGGHCPFRDFGSERVRLLLNRSDGSFGTRSITVAVREGTYAIEPMLITPGEPPEPLVLISNAATASEAMVLVAYDGERVVLDGSCPPTAPLCDSPEDPGRIWNLLAVSGSWVLVEGLIFDDVHKWNITVASDNTCIRDNEFIGSYGSDSDSMKGFNGSGPHVIVRGNDFHTGYEQAIDATNARGWLIEDNDFHDAPDRGLGFKFGASGNIVRNNRFTRLGGDAVSLGGTSSPHDFPYEAQNLIVEGNRATDLGGALFGMYSCRNCAVRDNVVDGARYAWRLQGNQDDPSGCIGGCPLSADIEITGNRLRRLHGDPGAAGGEEDVFPPNFFMLMESDEFEGFTAGDNLYCLEPGGPAYFYYAGEVYDLAGWQQAVGTDTSSTVEPASAARCTEL
jgi:hypothetical protein